MSLVLLHTAPSNETLFSRALSKRGVTDVEHVVRVDLLDRATKLSLGDPNAWSVVETAMNEVLVSGAGLVCTCSTLGPVADALAQQGKDASRSDRFLAEAFLSHAQGMNPSGKCAVVIVAPSTKQATEALFLQVQRELGAYGLGVDVILIDGPWQKFLAGDHQGYLKELAKALDILVPENQHYEFFALAQASMGEALGYCEKGACSSVWTVSGALCDHLLSQNG